MNQVYLVGAVRTPIGRFGGTLGSWTAADLGVAVAQECLRLAAVNPEHVQGSIWGCARQAAVGPNIGRQISYRAGVPDTSPAFTVNQACGSGLQAIILAAQEILLGRAEIILAGGTESMSRVPYLAEGARWGNRMGNAELVDGMYRDGFKDPLSGLVMGETAEILPLEIVGGNGEVTRFANDEHLRPTDLNDLAKLKPVFSEDGTITAGNSSGITDGAAAVMIMSEEAVNESGAEPLGAIIDYEVAGVPPEIMGIGPVPAVTGLLQRQKLGLDRIDLTELNEAFAA